MELILGIGALIVVIVLTRRYHAWRIKRAYIIIIDDLKQKGAYSIDSAVDLPYAKRNLLKMGMRQHHPQAVDHLIMQNIVASGLAGRGDNLVTRCWGKVPSTSLSTSSGP